MCRMSFDQALCQVLQAIPDPISSAVVGVVKEIWSAVQQVDHSPRNCRSSVTICSQTSQNKHQIRLLFQRVCEILCSLKVPQNFGDEAIQKSVNILVRFAFADD